MKSVRPKVLHEVAGLPILGGAESLTIKDRAFDCPFTGKAPYMCNQGITAWDCGGRYARSTYRWLGLSLLVCLILLMR